MNIYEFEHDNGAKDWVFAPNIKEGKEFYLNFAGCGDLVGTKVKRIPKSKWSEMYILDLNEGEPYDEEEEYNEDDYCNGYKIEQTFAEYAKTHTHTDMIATTEY